MKKTQNKPRVATKKVVKKNTAKSVKKSKASSFMGLSTDKLTFTVAVLAGVLAVAVLAYVTFSKPNDTENSIAKSANQSTLMLESDSQLVSNGDKLLVKVYSDSGEVPINAVQAHVRYSTDKLKLDQIDTASSDYAMDAFSKNENGYAEIVRGSTEGLTGKNLIAILAFTAIASGDSEVSVDTSSSAVVDSVNNQETLDKNTITKLDVKVN